jgi:isopentenyl-diphosphate delta-isomerase
MNGLVEHEVCPVLVGFVGDTHVTPDPEEVDATEWVPWGEFSSDVLEGRRTVSPWATEQVPLLAALGPDPRSWPAAARSDLPPAAALGAGTEAV